MTLPDTTRADGLENANGPASPLSPANAPPREDEPMPAPLAEPSQDPRLAAQDPLTPQERASEAHSIVAGGGMVAGAAAGAAVGTAVAGPVGTIVGGTVGAIAGALGGMAAGEVGEDADAAYWREQYARDAAAGSDYTYEGDYAPAYRVGYEGRRRYAGRAWDAAETDLRSDWERLKGRSRLTWAQAREAGRAAWQRADATLPADASGTGR